MRNARVRRTCLLSPCLKRVASLLTPTPCPPLPTTHVLRYPLIALSPRGALDCNFEAARPHFLGPSTPSTSLSRISAIARLLRFPRSTLPQTTLARRHPNPPSLQHDRFARVVRVEPCRQSRLTTAKEDVPSVGPRQRSPGDGDVSGPHQPPAQVQREPGGRPIDYEPVDIDREFGVDEDGSSVGVTVEDFFEAWAELYSLVDVEEFTEDNRDELEGGYIGGCP